LKQCQRRKGQAAGRAQGAGFPQKSKKKREEHKRILGLNSKRRNYPLKRQRPPKRKSPGEVRGEAERGTLLRGKKGEKGPISPAKWLSRAGAGGNADVIDEGSRIKHVQKESPKNPSKRTERSQTTHAG